MSRSAARAEPATPPDGAAVASRMREVGFDPDSVRRFLPALQAALAKGDAVAVSRLVAYPLRVDGKPEIVTAEALVAGFDHVFDTCVRDAVKAQRFESLSVSGNGIMLGSGQLWLGGECEPDAPPAFCIATRIRVQAVNRGDRCGL